MAMHGSLPTARASQGGCRPQRRRRQESVPGSGERCQDQSHPAQQGRRPLGAGDVLMVTRLDRLAHSTRDLLNTLAAITDRKAGFRSLADAWADTMTS